MQASGVLVSMISVSEELAGDSALWAGEAQKPKE